MIAIIIGIILAIISGILAMSNKTNQPSLIWSILAVAFLIGGLALYPYCNVWQSELSGRAILREAESSRQVKALEAQATLDSAKLLAEAEVARARGVAEANKIVADGLGGPEGYLRYLYIDGLRENQKGGQVIYVPTEAGLPILESSRLRDK